jgi:hypothetical protein
MPRTYTMATLVERCQQRCDLENSDHISDAEWQSLISEAYGDLYSVVCESGLRYFETTTTVTATGATSYDEPNDHFATIKIERVLSDGTRYELTDAMSQEETYLKGLTGDARFYTLPDDQLYLYPNPTSGTYIWTYIAQPPDLTTYDDEDLVDVVTPAGEAYLLWGTAVKALHKSESNAQLAMAERDSAREKLVEWTALRAFNQPRRRFVVDEYLEADTVDPADWRNR